MTYRDYFKQLQQHDWYFSFSDDHSVYKAGAANLKKLKDIAAKSKSPLPQKMFDTWQTHINSSITDKSYEGENPKLEDFKH